MNEDGITITEGASGSAIIMGATGIQIGSSGAMEPFLLGNQFMANVTSFLTALNTHTHLGNMGAPTSPPVAPVQLQVPLSAKHTVE
jgi:hypothetical protein